MPHSPPVPSDSSGTLYDPPVETEAPEPNEEETVALRLSLPSDRAQRLRTVAQQLGLNPSLVAKRAIEMVCDEVVTIQDDERPTGFPFDQYQARLDLLHSLGDPDEQGHLESPPTAS